MLDYSYIPDPPVLPEYTGDDMGAIIRGIALMKVFGDHHSRLSPLMRRLSEVTDAIVEEWEALTASLEGLNYEPAGDQLARLEQLSEAVKAVSFEGDLTPIPGQSSEGVGHPCQPVNTISVGLLRGYGFGQTQISELLALAGYPHGERSKDAVKKRLKTLKTAGWEFGPIA